MPGTSRTDGPRHLAGDPHRSSVPPHRRATHLAGGSGATDVAEPADVVRVPRHRLALALAVTVAALPVLVLDNLPATADTGRAGDEPAPTVIERALRAAEVSTSEPTTTTVAPTTTAAPSPTTTATPTTTTAPPRVSPPTTAAPPTTEAPQPAPASAYGDPNDPASWDRLAQCESGGDWQANTGNGYYGGLQFSLATWQHYGGTGYPHQAPKATQIEIGKRVQASEGWEAWPGCSRELGYS